MIPEDNSASEAYKGIGVRGSGVVGEELKLVERKVWITAATPPHQAPERPGTRRVQRIKIKLPRRKHQLPTPQIAAV